MPLNPNPDGSVDIDCPDDVGMVKPVRPCELNSFKTAPSVDAQTTTMGLAYTNNRKSVAVVRLYEDGVELGHPGVSCQTFDMLVAVCEHSPKKMSASETEKPLWLVSTEWRAFAECKPYDGQQTYLVTGTVYVVDSYSSPIPSIWDVSEKASNVKKGRVAIR